MGARALAAVLLRLGLLAAGAGALLYATLVLVAVPQPSSLERAAARIVMGDRYRPEEFDRLAPAIADLEAAPIVRASSLRAAAIVALRQAETAMEDGRRAAIDTHIVALERLLPRALSGLPDDAFLWLALFWRDNTALGLDQARLPLLAKSYASGPNEGWIAVKRSVIALALWAQLSPVLRDKVAREFAGLVQSRFAGMADVLLGPGWAARDVLLPTLAQVDEPQRVTFARAAYRAGADINVPGVPRPGDRPWWR